MDPYTDKYGNHDSHPLLFTDADRHANGNTDVDSDTIEHQSSHSYAYANVDPDPNPYLNWHPDTQCNAGDDASCNAHCDTEPLKLLYANSHGNGYRVSHPFRFSEFNSLAFANAYAHRLTHGKAHAYTHGDKVAESITVDDRDPHGDGFPNVDSNRDRVADTEPNSHPVSIGNTYGNPV